MRSIFYLFAFLLLAGCKERMMECSKDAPSLYVTGYDSTEIDSIMVSQFPKESNFSNKIEDIYFIFSGPLTVTHGKDSFYLDYPNYEPYYREYENFDWRYTVLSDESIYDVTNARRKLRTTSYDHPQDACGSHIVEVTVNGRTVIDEDGVKSILITKP